MAANDTWDLAQTDAAVPPPPPSAAPAAAADPTSDYIRQQLALLQAPLPSVQPDTTPVKRGFLSLLGEAIGGGPTTDAMSPAQRERAGLRALGDFGTSLMAGSGYYPGKPMFGGLAQGFQGAETSERGSEQQAASYLGAQQTWQMEQQKLQLERLKEALPLLQMQYGASIPNPLLSANTPAVPGTAGGAGKPGGGGIALGMRQNNPLNLTFAGQPGAQPGQGNRFATFSDLPSGVAATADQLALYQTQHGINTVQDAVKRWVSDPKADLTSYTTDVAKALGVAPTDKIDLTDPTVQQKFILAAQPHESGGGGAVLNPADVAKGVQLAAANRGQTVQAPPAPYQVAGKTVAPPSGSTTAPADTTTTTADATPPPPASPAPGGQQTFEQFQAQHPIAVNAADYTVTPPGLAEARAAQTAAAQQLSLARAGRGGDPNKSLSDYNTATQAVNKLQQDAQAKSLELQQAAQKNALDTQRQLYADEQQRQQQAKLKADELAQTAAENEKNRQATQQLEQTKAGITQRQKQADADVAAGSKLSETYDAHAAHAGEIHTMLAQLGPNLQNLPQGFTAQLMAQHPGLVTTMANAGLIDPKTRDAVQLVTGLNNYLSVALRPPQSGSLRNTEMEKFQAALPSMLQSPTGQQKALAFLLNMTDRVQKEADYVRGQFHRPIPDPTNPNATLPAYNLPPDLFSKMDKDLGPVLPHYSGGAPTDATAADYQKYVQSQKPGMPYYGYTRVVRNGQPVLDKNGRQVMREELQVAPEE